MSNKLPSCTLSDAELIAAVNDLVSRLCKDPRAWQMCVPPNMDKDSDMLICELSNRFKRLTEAAGLLKEAAETYCTSIETSNKEDFDERLPSYKSFKLALTQFEP